MLASCYGLTRTANSVVFKKSMLLFYEQNNMVSLQQIFIDQFEFAVTPQYELFRFD